VAILAWVMPCAADGDAAFARLLAAAKADPEGADYRALRLAFTRTSAYTADGPGELDAAPLVQELKNGERAAALVALDRIMEGRWTDPRAHELAAVACERLGEDERMRVHEEFADGLMGSILDGGDGRSMATAWPVMSDMEERLVIEAMGLKGGERTVVVEEGHTYHVYRFRGLGGDVRLYFEADVPAGWRRELEQVREGEARR
jgi:hypothetical protein